MSSSDQLHDALHDDDAHGHDALDAIDEATVHTRAELLPEERAAGPSTDPEAQAAAILAESEDRVNAPSDVAAELDPENADYQAHEHRRSEDTV